MTTTRDDSDKPQAYGTRPGFKSGAQPTPSAWCDASDPRNLWRLAAIRQQVETGIQQCVDAAREAGESWSKIGTDLGITKQAAQQRYGTKKPAVDTDAAQMSIDEV